MSVSQFLLVVPEKIMNKKRGYSNSVQRPRIGDGWKFNELSARTSADKRTKSTEYEQKFTIEFSAGTKASKRTKS